MEKLYLFNTLTRKKEEFKPIKKGQVGIYTCGPTVYWSPHIGNMKAYIFADTLKRTLLYNGYKVKQVINVTDVGHLTSDADEGEDKMEVAAKREHKTAGQIAEMYLSEFKENIKMLNILEPDVWAKATEHIEEQIELIQKLEKKGYTYKTSDGIYFDTSKFKDYGKLAKLKKEGLKAGKRVEMREKKNSTDFALWKFSPLGSRRQQEWNTPLGLGFPGWHIECSAMSMKYLGEHFDIHTGGEDHVQVHHSNEIAQSECATGKKFVNYWLHSAFLTFKGEKVSKSKGGLYTVSELKEQGYDPLAFRFFVLLTHYRNQLDFTDDNLDSAKNAYEKIKRKIIELRNESHKGEDLTEKYEQEFLKTINDDLNTPKVIQVVHRVLDDFDFSPKKKLKLLEKWDEVLGLGISEMQEVILIVPKEVEHFVKAREEARIKKMWAEADILRERIKEKGYSVSDTPQGPKLERI